MKTKLLIIIKPGFLDKTSEVIENFNDLGFYVIDRKKCILTREQCEVIWCDIKRYAEEKKYKDYNENYFNEYCAYITSGDVECISLECEGEFNYEIIWEEKRKLRKKNNLSGMKDLLHTSDSAEDAEHEISCIF